MKKDIAPFVRRLLEPFFFRFSRSPRYAYWKLLEKTQYLPLDQLLQIQNRRLKKFVAFVYKNNEFYRRRFENAGMTPMEIQSPEDLKRLPVLTKKEIRNNGELMISAGYSKDNLLEFKTGGSTGKSLVFYVSEECSEIRNAMARRNDHWSGWEPGENIAAIWGNPVVPKGLKSKATEWLLSPYIYLDTMDVTIASVRNFVKEWDEKKPTLIFGHAHSIYLLAKYLSELNIRHLRPKGIISSSMMLLPNERIFIEEIFRTKVTNRYGCEEVSLIASECACHNGMHLNIEHLIVEVLRSDGSPAAFGEPGKIVVTDLMNYAMPFVRYQVEDVGVLTDRKCSCGRDTPLLDRVTGRVADFLIKKDGSRVAGISLIENTLTRMPGINQMQIVQESIDHIDLNIVPETDFSPETVDRLIRYFGDVFGKDSHIRVNLVDKITPETSGKYRFSICRIPNQN